MNTKHASLALAIIRIAAAGNAGRWVTLLAILFCLELFTGIVLVHFKEGWFVAGGGRNGMEYGVLLILCFAAQAVVHWKRS
jgi:putative oxidoreductase